MIACGIGIKNLHLWHFISSEGSAPQWICFHDIVTNGISVECVEICHQGNEIRSKSTGGNIRLWNLTADQRLSLPQEQKQESKLKTSFNEIANTQDARFFLNHYAICGFYNLIVINMSLQEHNRDEISFPIPTQKDDIDSSKKKRKLREIDRVAGIDDIIFLLCSDSVVLYYRIGLHNPITLIQGLTYVPGEFWILRKIENELHLIRSCKGNNGKMSRIEIKPLSQLIDSQNIYNSTHTTQLCSFPSSSVNTVPSRTQQTQHIEEPKESLKVEKSLSVPIEKISLEKSIIEGKMIN